MNVTQLWRTPHESSLPMFYADTQATFSFAINGPAGGVNVGLLNTVSLGSTVHSGAGASISISHNLNGDPVVDFYSACSDSWAGADSSVCGSSVLQLQTGVIYNVKLQVDANSSPSNSFDPAWFPAFSGGGTFAAIHPYFSIQEPNQGSTAFSTPFAATLATASAFSLVFSEGFGNVAPVSEPPEVVLLGAGLLIVAGRLRRSVRSSCSG